MRIYLGRGVPRYDQGDPKQPGDQPKQPQGKGLPLEQPKPKPKEHQISPEDFGFQYKCPVTQPLPPKPKPGELGQKIRLISNCFPLTIPSGNVYHYDIEIISKGRSMTTKPALKEQENIEKKKENDGKYRCMSTKRNREIINVMLEVNDNFRGRHAAYDGKKNLYTRTPLRIDGPLKCEVVMPDENSSDSNHKPDVFEVIIKPVQKKESNDCSVSLDPLHALFQGRVKSVPQEAVMALETVLRHGPCLRYFPVGRSFFYPPDPRDVHPLGGGKEIWFGYHQSLRLGQWKPLVNLDVTATTFYEKGPLMKYVKDIISVDINNCMPLPDSDIRRLSKELKNMRIETTHLKNYRRKYRILKFTRDAANKLHFELKEKGMTVTCTVADYFAKQYNKPLRYPHLPCVQANPEAKKVYLPIEVCEMVEGQHCKKKLEDKQNAEMIKFTARPPKTRFSEIQDILHKAKFNRDPYLQEFGMSVASRSLSLTGRVLEAPNVRYQNETSVKPNNGSWDMRDKQYFRGAEINSWVLFSFSNPRWCRMDCLERFAKLLVNIAHEQGIRINRPAVIDIVDMRRQAIQNILKDAQKRFQAELAVIVVPGNNKTIYGEVKQAAETMLGLVTQCIRDENVSNPKKCSPPLVSNLCQKINAKMGGVNNSLTPGETPPILRRPIIIIGADVTHPSPSQDIKPSIAAAVGSLDSHPSRYAVTIRAQTNMDEKKQAVEIIQDLTSMILDLLKAFYRNTKGKKPEKIIFFRDGVSEGQFDKVRDHEVKCIREACSTLEADYQPGITFIVVQKRHHTRFMPEDPRRGAGKMQNIPPGTTVDTEVVHPLNFDFYLCSHYGLQGTSRPCHYTVIEDDNDFTADDLQKLTYYLCHTYVRCTKSISCPAPVMYAHLAAFRSRQHLLTKMDESSSGSDTSSTFEFHPIPDSVMKAIKVVDGLKNTMYFV
ncbi:Protein argonaute-3 like protein [Argiope bruennichi]|uniref:Protein argonaute-3 like protein n=1 Tax=Argiope bruennichi TaxID=94029 RepID=A0A8T0ELH6_ARGBR|nr:Protein argonaute-3 like protein [Argiope bruennichi]